MADGQAQDADIDEQLNRLVGGYRGAPGEPPGPPPGPGGTNIDEQLNRLVGRSVAAPAAPSPSPPVAAPARGWAPSEIPLFSAVGEGIDAVLNAVTGAISGLPSMVGRGVARAEGLPVSPEATLGSMWRHAVESPDSLLEKLVSETVSPGISDVEAVAGRKAQQLALGAGERAVNLITDPTVALAGVPGAMPIFAALMAKGMVQQANLFTEGVQRIREMPEGPERRAAEDELTRMIGGMGVDVAALAIPTAIHLKAGMKGEVGGERVRGSVDVNPHPELGEQHASAIGQLFAQGGKIDAVLTDPESQVSMMTAQRIAQAGGVEVTPVNGLARAFRYGGAEGRPMSEVKQLIEDHISKTPDKPIPGMGEQSRQPGESFNQYAIGQRAALDDVLQTVRDDPSARIVVVGHGRALSFYEAEITGNKKMYLSDGGHDPVDGARRLWIGDKGEIHFDPVNLRSEEAGQPGAYFVRHAVTEWTDPKRVEDVRREFGGEKGVPPGPPRIITPPAEVERGLAAAPFGVRALDLGDGWTGQHQTVTNTFGLKGPSGEKLGGRILPDRIEMVSIGKGEAPDSRSGVDALRKLAQQEGKPVYFVSQELSVSGGKFRERMLGRGDLIETPEGLLLKGTEGGALGEEGGVPSPPAVEPSQLAPSPASEPPAPPHEPAPGPAGEATGVDPVQASPEAAARLPATLQPPPPDQPPPGGIPGEPSPYNLPITEQVLDRPTHSLAVKVGGDWLVEQGIARDPNRLMRDQIIEAIQGGRMDLTSLNRRLAEARVTMRDFLTDLFPGASRYAGQQLNMLSQVARRMQRAGYELPEEARRLPPGARETDEIASFSQWWRRLEAIRRAMLVAQLSTASRNTWVDLTMRMPMQVFEYAIEGSLQAAVGQAAKLGLAPNFRRTVHPLDGFIQLASTLRGPRAKTFIDAVFGVGREIEGPEGTRIQARPSGVTEAGEATRFPEHYDRLFGRFSAETGAEMQRQGIVLRGADKILGGLEAAAYYANTIHRAEQFFLRRGVFRFEFLRDLGNRGYNVDRMLRADDFSAVPKDVMKQVLDNAVERSLYNTFNSPPRYGSVSYWFTNAVTRIPGGTLLLPFPRFLTNVAKFMWEYSPASLAKLLLPSEWGKIAKGDMSAISKGVTGTTMLMAAYGIRNSEAAGEKWYELRIPDSVPGLGGRTIDARPFHPFAAYLFLADMGKRLVEGKLDVPITAKEFLEGTLSTQLRAGTGLAIADEFFKSFSAVAGDERKLSEAAARVSGEYTAGWLTPLQTLTDVYNQFLNHPTVVKDRSTNPFWAPSLLRFPEGGANLPPAEYPTRAGGKVSEFPGLHQATGLIINAPGNPVEREIDRLHLQAAEVFRGMGEPSLNLRAKHFMGQVVQESVVPVVESEGYKAMSDAEKHFVLGELLSRANAAAKKLAAAEQPEKYLDTRRGSIRRQLLRAEMEQQAREAGENPRPWQHEPPRSPWAMPTPWEPPGPPEER